MDKKDFKKVLTNIFVKRGFEHKSNHFYKDISDDNKIVFGLNASNYSKCYYLEYGYCFKEMCSTPYPKYTEMQLYWDRFMTEYGQAFEYEKLNEESFITIEQELGTLIETMTNVGSLERSRLIGYFLNDPTNYSWYILGDDTAAYFGMTRSDFKYHFVDPNV